jgi:hypothetical protein
MGHFLRSPVFSKQPPYRGVKGENDTGWRRKFQRAGAIPIVAITAAMLTSLSSPQTSPLGQARPQRQIKIPTNLLILPDYALGRAHSASVVQQLERTMYWPATTGGRATADEEVLEFQVWTQALGT